MIHDLAELERRFRDLRQAPPDLLTASRAALEPGWLPVARAIATALDQAPLELAYHNRHHFAEATIAMGLLCAIAQAQGRLSAEDAALGVLAMLGHDIDHDGSAVADGRLEAASARRVASIAGTAGLTERQCARISDVILATDPARVARNAAACGTPAGLLRCLANEADVFASLLPKLGWELGDALAAERGLPADRPGREMERRNFLRIYDRFSAPAIAIGLADIHAGQSLPCGRSIA